jgi:hypothetical protein
MYVKTIDGCVNVFIHYIILLYCSDREPAGNNQARPQILCDELPSAIQLASMVLPSRLARYFDPASMIPMTVQTSGHESLVSSIHLEQGHCRDGSS